MPDREKVISTLEDIKTQTAEIGLDSAVIAHKFIDEILSLLKEQESVRTEREHSGGGTTWWNVCGNCKTAINPNDKFCHECGRAVKWND